jgi:hypothetical protein
VTHDLILLDRRELGKEKSRVVMSQRGVAYPTVGGWSGAGADGS